MAKAVLTIAGDERYKAIISLSKDAYPLELANQATFAKTFFSKPRMHLKAVKFNEAVLSFYTMSDPSPSAKDQIQGLVHPGQVLL